MADINETLNLGPVHIDQIDIPGMSLFDIHELVNIGPFRIEPSMSRSGAGHPRNDGHPAIVFLPSMTIGGQTYTIPLDTPRPLPRRPSDFRCCS
ncbi:hypothetical protein ACQKB2_17860 [Mycobacterium tuberculosis]